MTVRVAFRYNDKRIFARLVVLVRGGDSAHCEISDRWDNEGGHSCVSASFLDGGVRRKFLTLPKEKWRIYELDSPVEAVADWYKKHVGKGYDILGLLGFIVRTKIENPNRFFCSEAVAAVLGLFMPWTYDPRKLEVYCKEKGKQIQ